MDKLLFYLSVASPVLIAVSTYRLKVPTSKAVLIILVSVILALYNFYIIGATLDGPEPTFSDKRVGSMVIISLNLIIFLSLFLSKRRTQNLK